MNRRVTLAAALLLGSAAALHGQPAERALTLDEAIAATLTENAALQAADHALRAAAERRRAAAGLRLPQLSLTGAYTYLDKDIGIDLNRAKSAVHRFSGDLAASGILAPGLLPTIQGLLSPILEADWNLKLQDRSLGFVGGEATLPIWMGGRINAANRAARIDEESVRTAGDGTRNGLITETVERYYGLALALQVVEVRRQVVEGVRSHLKDAVELESNGMIPRSERLYVEVKMAEAERALEEAELQVETIEAALENTLGGGRAGRPVSAMFLLDSIEPLDRYRQLAGQRSPLLRQGALKRQLADVGVRVKRAEFLPQVVAMAGGSFYNYQVSGIVPRWAVGIGLRIRLFDGLRRERDYAAARQTVREVEALERQAATGIGVLVEQRYNSLLSYRYRMTSIERSLDFATEYLRMKEIAFREGIAPSSELIDAELDLAAIRTERLEAAYRFDLALAQLLEAAGISEAYTAYLHRDDARLIRFDK